MAESQTSEYQPLNMFPLYQVIFRRPDGVEYNRTLMQTGPVRELFAGDHGLNIALGNQALNGLGGLREVSAEEYVALGATVQAAEASAA